MSNDKVYPTHRISFCEKSLDGNGREKLGAPVDVAVVWPRKGDKQGGIMQWNISPQSLNEGVFFINENERQKSKDSNQAAPFEKPNDKESARDKGMER